ncbi:antibiotic biosynthesis monooxygenase [Sphingomicrobium nitratireducens]|uniref:antibiotic biosynthesis monooxygenase n=1 Tax=Sphingomicrobium nitratireducens TaxID=2964666 RepID=UPI00224099CE|nr:antibiotic biosynthesis monooxygenase [Sphingomicrobium nitratireducens]
MMATFFEWKVDPDKEDQFRENWAAVTKRLHARGSKGSTLFRKEDGHFCAVALWPDKATRDAAFAMDETPQADTLAMREAVIDTIHRIDMDEIDNLWLV